MTDPGAWVWSVKDQQSVQVLAVLHTWGGPTLRVWAPTSGQVFLRSTDQTRPIDSPELAKSHHPVSYAAAAARVADALSRDEILAPIESSLIPLPHQFLALARAISSDRIRFLLTDEVGLGKTIEAGLILRKLKLRGLVKRTYMVPELLPNILCRIQRPWE